jgi:hypothetical protein
LRRHAFEVLVPVDKLRPFPQSALLFLTIRQTAMARILTRLFGLALVSAVLRVQAATAEYAISFIPPSPIAGQPVVARLTDDVRTLCSNEQGYVTREQTNITLNIYLNDTSCPPQDVVGFRDFPLGTLDAGTYQVLVQNCVDNPVPGTPPCEQQLVTRLVVGAQPVDAAPTFSLWGVLAVTFGLVIIGRRALSLRIGNN